VCQLPWECAFSSRQVDREVEAQVPGEFEEEGRRLCGSRIEGLPFHAGLAAARFNLDPLHALVKSKERVNDPHGARWRWQRFTAVEHSRNDGEHSPSFRNAVGI
jgi:hypothetical protein